MSTIKMAATEFYLPLWKSLALLSRWDLVAINRRCILKSLIFTVGTRRQAYIRMVARCKTVRSLPSVKICQNVSISGWDIQGKLLHHGRPLIQNSPMKCWSLMLLAGSFLLIPAQHAIAEKTPVEELIASAHRKFTEFVSDGERKAVETFFQNIQEGKKADFSPDTTTVGDPIEKKFLTDPVYADLWESGRVIKSDWLNWLCTDPAASKTITSKGIEIDEARISGKVDLSWLKLEFPIRTFNCLLTDDIILDRASIRGLQLQGTYIKGLHGEGLNVDRPGLDARG